MNQFLIVCPLVFLAGFIDSIAGGGGLISLPAYLIAGVSPHVALGTGKLSSFPGTVVSVIRFAKKGYIKWKLALICAVTAIIGSSTGATITLHMNENLVEHMMVIVLPIVAFYVLRNKKTEDEENHVDLPDRKLYPLGMASAFIVGLYNGLYGPGTGTFLILLFTGLVKLRTQDAAGIAKVINLASDVGAVTMFIFNGKANIALGLTAALFSMAGNYIGAGLVVNNGQKIVRPVILGVLVVLFVKVLFF